jgi:hypothetical protein
VKEEPESIVVEPNLHLEETDGNRFELFIDLQLGRLIICGKTVMS